MKDLPMIFPQPQLINILNQKQNTVKIAVTPKLSLI